MSFTTFLQAITPAGGVSADYTLVLLVGIVGALVVAVLTMVSSYFVNTIKGIKNDVREIKNEMNIGMKEIKDDMKVIYTKVYDVEDKQRGNDLDTALLKQNLVLLNKIDPLNIAEIILAKIMAAKG